jgi:hypothetical protein
MMFFKGQNEMKNVHNHCVSDSSYRAPLVFVMLIAVQVLLINSSSAENPWTEGDRSLVDEGNPASSDRNSWIKKDSSLSVDGIDESKYPPLDEDMTLGTGIFGGSAAENSFASEPSSSSSDTIQYYDPQSLGSIPVYPGSSQGNAGNYYNNNQIPPIRNRYQPAYRPGYGAGYGSGYRPGYGAGYGSGYRPGYGAGYGSGYRPGYSGMSGFPFGSGNSGFPFGGSNGSGFPFGGGNGFMPFSNSGFW